MTYFIKLFTWGLNFIYAFIKLFPTRKKVTFISRQSNVPSIEFNMIRDEIKQRDEGVEVVLLCKTLDGGVNSSIMNKVKYGLHMFAQMYHIATSKVVVLDTYCIVASLLNHKKELKIIQMWHSMGSMKLFGYTAMDKSEGSSHKLARAMKMHENYDYVFASAEAYKAHLAAGFRCDISKIVTMPLPRYDLLKSKAYEEKIREEIYSKYPNLSAKPLILYCPTFRKDESQFSEAVYRLVSEIDLHKYNLVVKLHPLSKVELNDDVVRVNDFSTFDMLFAADYVISDYSCVVYEAAVRHIPLYFYNFDMELYEEGRGLAIDYNKELPGVISKEAKEIIKSIHTGIYDMEELARFADKYVTPVESATGNIVDFIWKFIGD